MGGPAPAARCSIRRSRRSGEPPNPDRVAHEIAPGEPTSRWRGLYGRKGAKSTVSDGGHTRQDRRAWQWCFAGEPDSPRLTEGFAGLAVIRPSGPAVVPPEWSISIVAPGLCTDHHTNLFQFAPCKVPDWAHNPVSPGFPPPASLWTRAGTCRSRTRDHRASKLFDVSPRSND